MRICALYNAPYDKKSFSVFMDMFHQDHNDIGKVPEFDFYAEDGLVNVVPETQQVS